MKTFIRYFCQILLIASIVSCSNGRITIILPESVSSRIQFGAEKLVGTLSEEGYKVINTNKQALFFSLIIFTFL